MQSNLIADRLLEGHEGNKVFDNPFDEKIQYENIQVPEEIIKEKFELGILNVEEIEIANQRINEMHPL